MGIEEGPFLPFCTKWKDLGKKNKLKYRSADWETLKAQGASVLKLPPLGTIQSSGAEPANQTLSSSLPDATSLQLSAFADKYRRFIPQENLEHVVAAAKAVEGNVVLPPLSAELQELAQPERYQRIANQVAQLPLRRPFEVDTKEAPKSKSKRVRALDLRDVRRASAGAFRSSRVKGKASEDDRVLSYVLGPPLDRALLALGAAEVKATSTQSLVRVEAMEVETEECLEVAAEQEHFHLERAQARQEQERQAKRLRDLANIKAESLSSRPSATSTTSTEVDLPRSTMAAAAAAAAAAVAADGPAAQAGHAGVVSRAGHMFTHSQHVDSAGGAAAGAVHGPSRLRPSNLHPGAQNPQPAQQQPLHRDQQDQHSQPMPHHQEGPSQQHTPHKEQGLRRGGLKRSVTMMEFSNSAKQRATLATETLHREPSFSEAGNASGTEADSAVQRMQRYISSNANLAGPSFAARRASFAGNLLGASPTSDKPDGAELQASRSMRQSQNGLAAVLQPKLTRLPSVAACRRLSKRHTWFGLDDDEKDKKKKQDLLNEEEEDRDGRSSSASSVISGLEINANKSPRGLQPTDEPSEHDGSSGSSEAGEDGAPELPAPSPGPQEPPKQWPRLKPRVSVIASVLAAGAALGIPALAESPSGPADVAAVAVLWAAWAREPESTKSRLVLPVRSQELLEEELRLSPRSSASIPNTPKVTMPTIQAARAEGLGPSSRPVTPLDLPPSHHLLQELLQPHPRRACRLCGVSLSFLVTLGGLLVAELGPQRAWLLSTKDVSEWLLRPLTQKHKSSIVELLPDEAVGAPQHMVSHSLNGAFLGLVCALAGHFSADSFAQTFLWVDFLSCNPFSLNARSPSKQVAVVRDVIRSTHSTLLILDAEGRALSRTWVLYEVWCSCIPSIPDVTVPAQAPEPAPPTTPGAPKLVLLLPSGLLPSPMLTKALKTACVTGGEVTVPMEQEAMLDQMRRVTTALSAYRAKMELLKLPEYKRLAKDYFLKGTTFTEAVDPLIQADTLIRKSLVHCIHVEASMCAQQLDAAFEMTPPALSASIRRACQLGTLMMAASHSSEMVHLLSRATILAVDGQHADLCVADLMCAATLLVHALLAQGRVRSGVIVARKLLDALNRTLPKHPCAPAAYNALFSALHRGVQHNSSEIVSRASLRLLKKLFRQIHPHLQHLLHIPSRPQSLSFHRNTDSPRAARSVLGSIREQVLLHDSSQKEGFSGSLTPPASELSDSSKLEQEDSEVLVLQPEGKSSAALDGAFAAITTHGGVQWWWGLSGAAGNWGEREVDVGGFFGMRRTSEARPEAPPGIGECDDGRRYWVRVDLARAAWALGLSLQGQQRWDEAEGILVHAAGLLQCALGVRHPYIGLVLLSLGEVAAARKDHLEASSCFMQARPLLLSAFTQDSSTWIQGTVAFAASLHALGDLDTAEKMMRRLLRPPVSVRKLFQPPNALSRASSPSQQKRQQQQQQQEGTVAGSPKERRTADGGDDDEEEDEDADSPQIKEWLLNEDEQEQDKRLAGQSYQVLSLLAKILITRSVRLPFQSADDVIADLEQKPSIMGQGPIVWRPEEKAYIRMPKAGLNVVEVRADVKTAMEMRAKGQHLEVDVYSPPLADSSKEGGVGLGRGPKAGREGATEGELPMRSSTRGVSFAGDAEGGSLTSPSKNPTHFPSMSMLTPRQFEDPKPDTSISKVEITMSEAVSISARLLTRLQEAIKRSRQYAEAGALTRLRAMQAAGSNEDAALNVRTRRDLRGQKTMVAHDYATRIRISKAGGDPKAAGVGWDADVGGGGGGGGARSMRRRSSIGGGASTRRQSFAGGGGLSSRRNSLASNRKDSIRENLSGWSSAEDRAQAPSGAQPPGTGAPQQPQHNTSEAYAGEGLPEGKGRPRQRTLPPPRQPQQPLSTRRAHLKLMRDGVIKGASRLDNWPADRPGTSSMLPHKTSVSSASSLSPRHSMQPDDGSRNPGRRAHPAGALPAKHRRATQKRASVLPSARDDRRMAAQEETKTVSDIPAAIATAAGLAAEGAEREAWRLLSLQMADIYVAHAKELHLGAEINAAIMALQAARSIFGALGGYGSSELMNTAVCLANTLICSRRFIEARQVLVDHEKSITATVTEKAALRSMIEEKATEHLFRAATLGDEELAFWSLDLGAKAAKPLPMEITRDTVLLPMASALVLAVSKGHIATATVIVAMAPHSVEEEDGVTGMLPLSMAASLGDIGMIIMLLESKAGVDAVDKNGRTALMLAAMNGHHMAVGSLISRGHASLNVKDSQDGMTALMLAAARGHDKVVKALLEGLAGTGMLDSRGRTALIWAAMHGHVQVLEDLLTKSGTRTNTKDEDGMSALSYACLGGYLDCVKMLVAGKADLRIFDNQKQTPLHKAAVVRNPEVMCLLLMERPEVSLRDTQGRTALHLAASENNSVHCALLIYYVARNAEMASGNNKALVNIPHLQLYFGGKVDGVDAKIGSKVDNTLKGRPVTEDGNTHKENPLIPMAIFEANRLKQADEEFQARRAREAEHLRMLQEEMYEMQTLSERLASQPGTAQRSSSSIAADPRRSSQPQAPLPPLPAGPLAAEGDLAQSQRMGHSLRGSPEGLPRLRSPGTHARNSSGGGDDGPGSAGVAPTPDAQQQPKAGGGGLPSPRPPLPPSPSTVQHGSPTPTDSPCKVGSRGMLTSGAGQRSKRPSTGGVQFVGTPSQDGERPYNLELLLPYAKLSQVRFFVGATDKYGCTAVDVAATAGHIHLAQLLHQFLVFKAPT